MVEDDKMILMEGSTWRQLLSKTGTSVSLIISPAMQEYLGIDRKCLKLDLKTGKLPVVVCKADFSKRHGAFIGFGADNEEDAAAFQKACEESRARKR